MSGELLRCAVCRTEIPRGENGFVVCQGCNDTSDLYKLYAHHKARADKAEAEVERLGRLVDICADVIGRTKKQCGDYREQCSDLQKEVERLKGKYHEEMAESRRLRPIVFEVSKKSCHCGVLNSKVPCLACRAGKALGGGE